MPLPNPTERPDLYDSFDLPAQAFVPDPAYREATMPAWMREAIAAYARPPSGALPAVQVRRMSAQRVAELLARVTRTQPDIAVVQMPNLGTTEIQAMRHAEAQGLRRLADELERGSLDPGPLIVNLLDLETE